MYIVAFVMCAISRKMGRGLKLFQSCSFFIHETLKSSFSSFPEDVSASWKLLWKAVEQMEKDSRHYDYVLLPSSGALVSVYNAFPYSRQCNSTNAQTHIAPMAVRHAS